MQILCGQCGRASAADDAQAGATVPCPHCGREILVPDFNQTTIEAEGSVDADEMGFAEAAREIMGRKIVIACGACGKNLRAPRKLIGKKVRCPSCRAKIRVPSPDADEPVLTVGAQSRTRSFEPPADEDIEGLPVAKLVYPPLPGWIYFAAGVLAGCGAGLIALAVFR